MPRRLQLQWSPQFRSSSSARAVSGSNTGISGNTACSMFAYFYINTIPSTQLIMSMGASSGSHAGLQLRVLSTTSVDVNIAGIGSIPVSGLQSIVQRWCSIAVTKTSGSSSHLLYFNGVAVNGGGTGTPNFTNSPLYLGSDQTPTAAFNGNISCAGIWNAELSAAQILALHNQPSVIQGTPTVFYRMTEGTGTTLIDASGNANNGTLTSTSWDGGQVPYGVRAPLEIQSPNDILSPLFYLDSRYGVTDTGGKASAWLDQSPNAISFTQSTDAERPTIVASGINSLQSLRFTAAADEYMTGTTNFIGGAKEHTLFCVLRGRGTGPGAFVGFVALGSGGAGGNTSAIGLDNTNKFWFGGAGDGVPTINATIANSTSYTLVKASNGSFCDVYYNGDDVLAGFPQLVTTNISVATDALIGRYVGSGGVMTDMDLAVACAWNRRLSHAEVRALNNWANRVWGVGGSVTRTQIPFRTIIGDAPIRNWSFEYQPAFTAATNVQARWIDGTAAGTTTDPGYGWAVLGLTGTAQAQYDTAQSFTGSGSMKLSTTAAGSLITVSNIIATTQPFTGCPASPSTEYTCTFKMKTNYVSGDSSNGASVAFVERNAAGTAVATPTSTLVKTTTDWNEYMVSFTTTATTMWICPRPQIVGNTGTGTLIMDAWFDDIRVTASVNNRTQIT